MCPRCGSATHRLYKCPQRLQKPSVSKPQRVSLDAAQVMAIAKGPGGSRLLYHPIRVGSHQSDVLVDSGASVNCIDEDLLAKAGGKIAEEAPGRLLFPDQREAQVQGVARIGVKGRGYQEIVDFWVVKGLGIPVLFGEPWLRRWNPAMDWETREMRFSDGVTWKARRPPGQQGEEETGGKRRGKHLWAPCHRQTALRIGKTLTGRGEDGQDDPAAWAGFEEVFEDPKGVPTGDGTQHRIALREGARPYQKTPYRMSVQQRVAMEEELGKFRSKGWIRPSTSEWATVALVVPKKDGKMRVCIDYRDLNAISAKDAYPLPRIDELLNRLAHGRWFTKMDLQSGFHQIPMEPASIPYTAFRIGTPLEGCSLFEWTVMPMGLSTAPSTFQRWMDGAMRGLEDIVLMYLDDVLVFSASRQQYEVDVRRVLERFRSRGMKVKREKCEFMKEEMGFLGHTIRGGRICVDQSKLPRLAEWEGPLEGVKQVRQLMGFLSYYRAFIPHFATVTAPLTDLTKGGRTWQWTEQATRVMDAAKRALYDACQRYAWSQDRLDRVTTDASGVGLGATFEQRVEGVGWAPVAFWSRKLSEAERRYSTTDQEWLAVVEAVTRHWRHWLKGRRFVLRSDHGALQQLLRTKGEGFSNRQHRWYERMQDYVFDFEHVAGTDNKAADALSRAPSYFVSALELGHTANSNGGLGLVDIRAVGEEDDDYRQEVERTSKGEGKTGWTTASGILMEQGGRIVVPRDERLRARIILEAHEPPFCGHLGVKKTLEQVARTWWWPTLNGDVKDVTESCDICQRGATGSRKEEAPLSTIVAEGPWEVVTMDFLSGFVPSRPHGWQGCVVVCDRFSRMIHVRECNTHPTAKEACQLFLRLVVRAHGLPRKIITDRGTQFDSGLWREVMDSLGTKVALASTHHPQTNGLTERMNRTLIGMIKKVCASRKNQWVEALPLLEFAYNNSVHRATGISPFRANSGRDPLVPAAMLRPSDAAGNNKTLSPRDYARQTESHLQQIWAALKEADQKEAEATTRRENRRRGNPDFQEGEEVMCRRFQLCMKGDARRKQEFTYDGPYLVRKVLRQGIVQLWGLPHGAPATINTQFIRRYKRHHPSSHLQSQPPPPPADITTDAPEWEVEDILAHRTTPRGREYLVRWKGYPQATWIPRGAATGCADLLAQYWRRGAQAS